MAINTSSFLLLLLVLLAVLVRTSSVEEELTTPSPETLYRQTVETWQKKYSRRSSTAWTPWKDFAKALTSRYESLVEKKGRSAVSITEIIGAMEEGILTIERIVFQEKESSGNSEDDEERDSALAELYTEYGRLLLYSSEPLDDTTHGCFELAKDPHTLLIGAPERLKEYDQKKNISMKDEDERNLINSLFGPLCKDNAENSLRNAISLDATCQEADQLLEKITGLNSKDSVHARKPKEFVAELFDSFAESFDEKLTKTLDYRVPQIIGSKIKVIVESHENIDIRNVLDAGCGTGLAGRELRNAIDDNDGDDGKRITLVGVDASTKMLEIAEQCTTSKGCGLPIAPDNSKTNDETKLYDALLDLDLEEMTLDNTLMQKDATFELIIAADVFVYFGSLERMMEVLSELSGSRGLLVFTCERATPEEAPLGFRLLPTGRFAHTKDHAVQSALSAGYSLVDYQQIVPRMEKAVAVDGHLFVFSKDDAGDGNGEAEL
uniref:Methyltransferase domain-containing protein n=1 Tax=Pseudo-nitzschia australis TaxID=44445 RepID=A0A7S4ENL1_9STRA|mmetsp:Transcript_9310/g.20182  ORF Transcript_9310/g.20182 Transcript_9310/m.20182 type:complete len:493 (+) Transcript_9310:49-1527(+)|eukprot:CAMPEP_0168175364 /NCGR_PEP_ID=MMETSP0139_2-20121125/7081_1 /TAXON_ID=44445 /ORGANISM="Pseudo-nitzschia australis, Strain 10249 10 AB" /LENGTH=492 /DNA_ID=CAMNT_0008093743 /DNA_START=52 /DNA_END=1530 /DNA_ORIENTATION=-